METQPVVERPYSYMNMSSTAAAHPVDDRTTRARIRDAAIASIADDGVAELTARKVAAAAGVSAGLVIHHFGSMEGLRAACDEHISSTIRRYKEGALSGGPSFDILAALRDAELGPLTGYLARVLVEDTPAVAQLVDDLVADAEGYIQRGVESGMLRASDDPHGRAVVLTLWNLGALVLHRHLVRTLGVDLTDPAVTADPGFASYARPVYEIYGEGILSEAFATEVRSAFDTVGDLQTDETTRTEGNT
jgi:AcrR family transcriptional regulator